MTRSLRRLLAACLPLAISGFAVTGLEGTAHAATPPSPPFTQCPAIGNSPSCGTLIVINPDGTATVVSDPSVGPYDGADDTLIGVQNNSGSPLRTLRLTGFGNGGGAFGFDGDGICAGFFAHTPAGCSFGSTGYEGPGTSFSNISPDLRTGNVNFSANANGCGFGLPPGQSAYFSLESAVNSSSLTLSVPSETGSAAVVQLDSPISKALEQAGPLATNTTPTSADATLLSLPGGLPLGLSASVAKAHVDLGFGSAESYAQVAQVNLGGPVGVAATAVKADSLSGCGGSAGDTTIASLTVAGKSLANNHPAPNQTTTIGGLIKVVLNEQIANADGSLTVNAVHVTAPLLKLDVIIASATSNVIVPASRPMSGARTETH